jgi:hypothetical protein
MFVIVPIIIGVIFVIVIVGMISHMVMFGTVFGLVVKRFSEAAEQQRMEQAALQPVACGYCGVTMPAGVTECPNCGGGKTDRVGAG